MGAGERDIAIEYEFLSVALQLSLVSAYVHGGGALRHLDIAPSIYTLSIYLLALEVHGSHFQIV